MIGEKMMAPHIKLCIFGSSALMLDVKMTAPHIKLCIASGSNVRRKNDGSTY